jgi:hypothetical protein
MNVGLLIALGCGMLIGLVLVAIILKVTKKDGSIKCKYDERQELARGKGFKYSFFTLLIYNVILAFGISAQETTLNHLILMMLILLGCGISIAVYVTYCIWKEAYISLNENKTRVLIAFMLIALSNFVIGFVNISNTGNTQISLGWVNVFCGCLFLEIFAAMGIKKFMSHRKED